MPTTIEKFSTCNKIFFEIACSIRTEVFVNEQHVPESIEYDGMDDESVHFLLFHAGKPIVTARCRTVENAYKLERFATLEPYRGKNFGKILLTFILDFLKPRKKKIYLHSQDSAVGFYLKNGFLLEGNEFYEADIKHFKMIYSKI